jgi:hypothetical protein
MQNDVVTCMSFAELNLKNCLHLKIFFRNLRNRFNRVLNRLIKRFMTDGVRVL